MYGELLSALINRAKEYLYSIKCKESTVERYYGYLWKRMLLDIGDKSNLNFKHIVDHCLSYYKKNLVELEYFRLTDYEKRIRRSFMALLDFKMTGKIAYISIENVRMKIDSYSQVMIDDYMYYQRILELKETTLQSKLINIKSFLGKYPLGSLNEECMLQYIKSFKKRSPYASRLNMNKIKKFLIYAKSQNYITNDFEYLFPTHKVSSTGAISSVYTEYEISKVVHYYKNRNDDCVKRNYTIILLLAFYGIRARDVILLERNNIDFTNNIISFVSSKTSVQLTYPLIPVVGNAIVDYLLNERPISNSNMIFLKKNHKEITNSSLITSIVIKAFSSCGIDTRNKHYGAHSLRSSLATRMMNDNVSIFTISKVLGHASIDTTKIYTKVDINHLRLCELEVIDYAL